MLVINDDEGGEGDGATETRFGSSCSIPSGQA